MSSLFPETFSEHDLPPCRTLLIQGPYHPSAPIHLCLSHTKARPNSKAMLLTPSRGDIVSALVEFDDDWVSSTSGHGKISELARRVDILYPPSPAHLSLLLSMLRTFDSSDPTSYDSKTTLDTVPALVVLHEPSAYFLANSSASSYTVSSYLSLVTETLACVSYLSAHNNSQGGISLALFDSKLDQLKLPVVRAPASHFEGHGDSSPSRQSPRHEPLSGLVQKYFEWVGTTEEVNGESAATGSDAGVENERRRRKLLLRQNESRESSTIIEWNWVECDGPERRNTERRGTVFAC